MSFYYIFKFKLLPMTGHVEQSEAMPPVTTSSESTRCRAVASSILELS
jgi:hypothetical protein